MLNDKQIQELYNLDVNDIATLKKALSNTYDVKTKKVIKPPFTPTEEFIMKKGTLYNKEDIKTTVGRYIVNKSVFREKILSFIGYQNKVITDDVYKKDIDRQICILLQQGKITSIDFMDYLNRLENFTSALVSSVINSFTEKVLVPNKKVIKRKEELIKKYKDRLDNKDPLAATEMEKELVDLAKKELEGDTGMDSYNSGARGSIASNYKEINIMKGPIFNPITNEWDIVTNSFEDGIDKKDIPAFANSVTTGAYPKAVGTAVSGHFSKKLIASLETVVLDDNPLSYCGTKKTLTTFIDSSAAEKFVGRTIKEGNKIVNLTYDNINSYKGKTVEMFSPIYCLSTEKGEVCGTCGDKRAVALGYKYIGMSSSRLSSAMLNMKMKQFHSATLKVTKLNKKDLFLK